MVSRVFAHHLGADVATLNSQPSSTSYVVLTISATSAATLPLLLIAQADGGEVGVARHPASR